MRKGQTDPDKTYQSYHHNQDNNQPNQPTRMNSLSHFYGEIIEKVEKMKVDDIEAMTERELNLAVWRHVVKNEYPQTVPGGMGDYNYRDEIPEYMYLNGLGIPHYLTDPKEIEGLMDGRWNISWYITRDRIRFGILCNNEIVTRDKSLPRLIAIHLLEQALKDRDYGEVPSGEER